MATKGFSTKKQASKYVLSTRRAENALLHMKEMAQDLQVVVDDMHVDQRKLFMAKLRGLDDLQALAEADLIERWIGGVAKIVYMSATSSEGGKPRPFLVKNLTKYNLENLDSVSYERLLKLANAQVLHRFKKYNMEDLLVDAKPLLKVIAPEMINTLTDIAIDKGSKNADRIKAANSLLDRAGVVSQDAKNPPMMPVQININFDDKPRAEKIISLDHAASAE
jgi:hypothetical protein